MIVDWYEGTRQHVRHHRAMWLGIGIVALLVIIIISQLLYPPNYLLPFDSIGGIALGGMNKSAAIKVLDNDYKKRTIGVYLPHTTSPYATVSLTNLGVSVSNESRVNQLTYPWYERLIPTSLLWANTLHSAGQPTSSLNTTAATNYLTNTLAPKTAAPAGVTTIITKNFVESSRKAGPSGRTLDVVGTVKNLQSFVSGKTPTFVAAVTTTPPSITYSNSYTSDDAGLAAVMKNFAATHPGTYGVSLIELTGQHRHATYESSTQFTTASTYKLFVAYSTLLRIESGAWHWSDATTVGYDTTTCFNRMIELSDNDCAEALLSRVGYTAVTNDAHAIGATHTSFLGSDGIESTADDEALLLSKLQTGEILNSQADRDMWISAMKQNVYRKGIPAGIPSAVVADKVGFLDALLHDAAIVYSPTGTYVLVILTNNSSWANIATLAGQLESVRNQ